MGDESDVIDDGDTDEQPAEEMTGATDAAAGEGTADAIGDAQAAIDEARRRVAEVPAEVVVTNHVMGLYELAASTSRRTIRFWRPLLPGHRRRRASSTGSVTASAWRLDDARRPGQHPLGLRPVKGRVQASSGS